MMDVMVVEAAIMMMTVMLMMIATKMITMMISGILGGQLGLFLGASLLTITEPNDDDDDDDFRHPGWPDGLVSGRQSADDH